MGTVNYLNKKLMQLLKVRHKNLFYKGFFKAATHSIPLTKVEVDSTLVQLLNNLQTLGNELTATSSVNAVI